MIIGHFAVAFLLIFLFPQVPVWVPLFGVSFPDLLWAVLLLAGKEKVQADKSGKSPNGLLFEKYPYSHSLVATSGLALVVGAMMGVALGNLAVAAVFALASASHWILDSLVHTADLPVMGFDGDRKVGLGLWRWGKAVFFLELGLYVVSALVFLPWPSLLYALLIGIVFHAINAPAVFRQSSGGLSSPKALALGALFVFGVASAALSFVI